MHTQQLQRETNPSIEFKFNVCRPNNHAHPRGAYLLEDLEEAVADGQVQRRQSIVVVLVDEVLHAILVQNVLHDWQVVLDARLAQALRQRTVALLARQMRQH